MENKQISLSIVSHGQFHLVVRLLIDIEKSGACNYLSNIIITNNIFERSDYKCGSVPIKVISNIKPKGFGENHNYAFKFAEGDFFCISNPDIQLKLNPFPALINAQKFDSVGLTVPYVYTSKGFREDSIRYFPNISNIVSKFLGLGDALYPELFTKHPYEIEWAAGMFMLFKNSSFNLLNGFDEKFFLYYEDVDICIRSWRSNQRVIACPDATVIHDAQRDSHKNIRYLFWHIKSLCRYLYKHWLRLPVLKNVNL